VVQERLVRFFARRAAASPGVALKDAPSTGKAAGVVRRVAAVRAGGDRSKHQKNPASANHPNTRYNHQPNVRAGYS